LSKNGRKFPNRLVGRKNFVANKLPQNYLNGIWEFYFMGYKIKIVKKLKEISAMGAGAVAGHVDNREELDEMYSSAAIKGGSAHPPEKEDHKGAMKAKGLEKHLEEALSDLFPGGLSKPKPTFTDSMSLPTGTPAEPSAEASPSVAPLSSGEKYRDNIELGVQPDKDLKEELEKHNIIIKDIHLDYLGGGKFGKVYRAFTIDDDFEGAIKIISGDSEDLQREVRNYTAVSKARKGNALIAKHFPEVYDAWIADVPNEGERGFIFMEVLQPPDPEAKKMVPGPAYFSTLKDKYKDRTAASLGQEISKKAEMFFKSDSKIFDQAKKEIEEMADYGKLDDSSSLMRMRKQNFIKLDMLANSDKADAAIQDRLTKAEKLAADKNLPKALEKLKFSLEDHIESNFAQLALLELFIAMAEVGTDRVVNNSLWQTADKSILQVLNNMQDEIRTTALTKGHYDLKTAMKNKPSSSLEKALDALLMTTRLYGRDLHWNNFMSREDGDLVIVDLGLFKTSGEIRDERRKKMAAKQAARNNKNIKESKNYRLKILTNRRK